MEPISPNLLKPELRKNQMPSLKQWLIGFALLLGLASLLLHYNLQDAIQHYQVSNQELNQQLAKLEQATLHKNLVIKHQLIPSLLTLITQHLIAGLVFTELDILGKNITLKGRSTSTELVKAYAQSLAPQFDLEDFSFTHDSKQFLEFKLRMVAHEKIIQE